LPSGFLVAAAEPVKSLPRRRLDDRQRNSAAGERRLDGADRAAILETAGRALLRHRLRALDECVLRRMHRDPGANRERVDALFRADARDRDIDCIKQ
jgi:hypothetical protein